MSYILTKAVKITVCGDGFVSVWDGSNPRRQGVALPVHSVDTYPEALTLIQKVCSLQACIHKGRLGTTLEPRIPNWIDAVEDITQLDTAGEMFRKAEGK